MKLNNKGFAITTIVYGLSIMGILLISIIMGVIATSRQHNRELAKKISEELIRYSKTSTSFDSTVAGAQEFVVPSGQSGWYKIELWGAQGGGTKGGLGAYTSGIIELNEEDTLYFYVGRHKTTGNGGEESDVRIRSGGYADVASYATRIMVAAGGGADEGADGGTIIGYNADIKPYGGQYDDDYNLEEPGSPDDYEGQTNGTLLGFRSNQDKRYWDYRMGRFGETRLIGHLNLHGYYGEYTSPQAENGGGDGYLASHDFGSDQYGHPYNYGGSMSGGVSYISGYGGCYAQDRTKDYNNGIEIQKVHTLEDSVYIHYEGVFNSETGLYDVDRDVEEGRKYYFYDGMMYPGVNKGDGKARITKLMDKTEDVQELPRHNSKLNNIRYIVSCVDASHSTSYGAQVILMSNGIDYVHDRYHSGNIYHNYNFNESGRKCVKYDLGSEVSGIDEIDIWQTDTYIDYKNTKITVGGENDPKCGNGREQSCSIVIKDAADYSPNISETKTYSGIRFSAYQFDSTKALPDKGNYIIQPVLYENMVMTAPSTADKEQNPIVVDYMSGDANQQWSIERIYDTGYDGAIYKIIDLARYKALSIKNDENKLGNTLIASREFNAVANKADETQLWRITPMRNGTYVIESVLDPVNSSIDTGYLVPQTNKDKDNYNKVIVGKKTPNPIVQRWKFISTDYSSKD